MNKFSLAILLLAAVTGRAQQKQYNLAELFKAGKLTVINRQATVVDNDVVSLKEGGREGLAWLEGVTFSSGTIEIDLKGKDVLQGSFIGVAFHGTNDSTYDAVYFRPFNFLSTDPVRKIHAVQYISHPTYGWEKLRNEHNAIYEKELVSPPDPNGWFHARIVVHEKFISVFVNDDKIASLTVQKLNDRKDGKLGLWVGDGSDGEFKNLTLSTL